MALTFDPFREMDRMAARLLTSSGTQRAASWMPMDLYRSGDAYVVNVDLPGVDPGSIALDVDANTLTIQAERTIGAADGSQWLAQERPAGRYVRQLGLGTDVDLEHIQASYEHGVLMLTIPIAERAKPRRITVEQRDSRAQLDAGSSADDARSAGSPTRAAGAAA
ncbi:Hsp20/alpha crystallin family protein [Agrococcus sp. Marseille-P2731]|uniref:Hsp20/alpha crystallin family protein n=1 Tax=Agrococcus sp. Marseille-P2731 TaxID=1841862 RepID=UPI0009301710|nr:Hsp20/alpha crystallin family protein [Agrococcus sp. Marseille-P2731]